MRANGSSTYSYAVTSTTGLTGNLYSKAESTKVVNAVVNTAPGSTMTTHTLSVVADALHNDTCPDGYTQTAMTNAHTVVQFITQIVDVVCNFIANIVTLWVFSAIPNRFAPTSPTRLKRSWAPPPTPRPRARRTLPTASTSTPKSISSEPARPC